MTRYRFRMIIHQNIDPRMSEYLPQSIVLSHVHPMVSRASGHRPVRKAGHSGLSPIRALAGEKTSFACAKNDGQAIAINAIHKNKKTEPSVVEIRGRTDMDVHKASVKMFRMLYQRHNPESETDLETDVRKRLPRR